MAIIVYEGTLGGGKSYHAVQHALSYLARGGRVYSNIDLVQDKCESFCRERYGVELDWAEQYHPLSASDIARLHEVVKGGNSDCNVLCILDEIHLYHNARDWANASRGLLQWLTQSRKMYVDVICITQHRNNLDKQWVRLVERYFRFRDMRKFRLPMLGIRMPFFECLTVEIDTDGKTVIDKRWERFDKPVFGCYSSDQLFDGCVGGFAGAGLARVKLEKTKGKSKMKLYIIVGLIVVALVVGVYYWRQSSPSESLGHFTGGRIGKKIPPSTRLYQEETPLPKETPPSPVPSSAPSIPPYVDCDGWTAKDGYIVGGYCSRYRLTFRGSPDRVDDGVPVYASRRGVVAF